MTPDTVLSVGRQALELTALLSAPLLLSALVIGVLVGMFQAATQINEMTLSFIPKLIVMALALMLSGSWMLSMLVDFTRHLFMSIPRLIG